MGRSSHAGVTAPEQQFTTAVTLESMGRRLDEPDLRIASIARSRDLIVVTGKTRHFGRVPDLEVENWLALWRAAHVPAVRAVAASWHRR